MVIQPISVTVIEDDRLFGECLTAALAEYEQFTVFNLVTDQGEAFVKVDEDKPDVVLIDRLLPNNQAIDLTRQVAENCPSVKVLMLSLAEEENEIAECVEAGVSGYVLRNSSLDELTYAIELVSRGETACSSEIAHAMYTRLSKLSNARQPPESVTLPPLSIREMEILQFIADGWSNQQIADQLCRSLYTVKNHVHNILNKLQVQRRSEAVNSVYELRRSESWTPKP